MADNKNKAKSNGDKASKPSNPPPAASASSPAGAPTAKNNKNEKTTQAASASGAAGKTNGKDKHVATNKKIGKLPADATPEERAANNAEMEKQWANSSNPNIVELYNKLIQLRTVNKPETKERDEQLAKLDAKRDSLKKESETLKSKLDGAKESSSGTQKQVEECRAAFNKVRDEQKAILEQRSGLVQEQKDLTEKINVLRGEETKLKAVTRELSPEEMEEEMARLEYKQQTSSYSLRDEKNILRKMEVLKSSKKNILKLHELKEEIKALNDKRKIVNEKLDEYKPSLDKYSALFTEKLEALKKAEAERQNTGANIPDMAARRKAIHEELVAINDKRQAVYNAWKAKEDEYYKCLREQKPVRDEIFKLVQEDRKKEIEAKRAAAEAKRLEEERKRAEAIAAKEAEEAKKKPWEKEIALCDILIEYLEGVIGKSSSSAASDAQKAKSSVLGVKPPIRPTASADGNPPLLGNLKPMKRKDEREEESFIKIADKKKPNAPKAGTSATATAAAASASKPAESAKPKPAAIIPLIIQSDMLQIFNKIDVAPPLTKDGIPKTIQDLKSRRDYFDTLPRDAKPQLGASADNSNSASSATASKETEDSSKTEPTEAFPLLPGQKEVKIKTSLPKSGPLAADLLKNSVAKSDVVQEEEEQQEQLNEEQEQQEEVAAGGDDE